MRHGDAVTRGRGEALTPRAVRLLVGPLPWGEGKRRDLQRGTWTRSAGTFDLSGINVEKRTVPLTFSSETAEVTRQLREGGPLVPEILLHEAGSVDLEFIGSAGSLLLNHDENQIIGGIESVSIDAGTRRGKAIVRFATTARGEEAFQLVQQRALKGVSFGYDWLETRELKRGEKFRSEMGVEFGGPALVVKRWRPIEITLTPKPADVSVGVGRSRELTRGGSDVSLKQFVTRECLRKKLGLRAAKRILDVAEDEAHAKELIDGLVAEIEEQARIEKREKKKEQARQRARAAADDPACRASSEADDDEEDADDAAADEDDEGEADEDAPHRGRDRQTRKSAPPRAVRLAERERVTDILARCREAGLDEAFADDLIERDVSTDAACRAILDEQKKRGTESAGHSAGGTGRGVQATGVDAIDKRLRWMEAGLVRRFDPLVRNSRLDEDLQTKFKIVTKDGEVERSGGQDDWGQYVNEATKDYPDSPLTMTEYSRVWLKALGIRNIERMDKREVNEAVFSLDAKIRAINMGLQMRAGAANVTASLPNVMANVLGKQLLRLWKRADPTWRLWCKVGTLDDYKPGLRILMSDVGDLLALNENGEIIDSQVSDQAESIQLRDYGRKVSLTHQMFINDDLNALATLTNRMGQAALRLPSKLVYTKLLANPTLAADSTALFHANHNNLNTGGGSVLGIAGLKQGVAFFRKQVSKVAPNENQSLAEPLDIPPRILLVGPTLEKAAYDLVNPNLFLQDAAFFKGKYVVAVEPRLESYSGGTSTRWFFAGDPGLADTFEVGFLGGSDRPLMRQVEMLDRLALDLQMVLPCAVAPLDYRAIQRNDGA